MQELQLI